MFLSMSNLLPIGEVARRSGVASSALRFYEQRGLISSERAGSGHRRYPRPVLRRIAFIVFAQRIGLTLEEIGAELAKLPPNQAPTRRDWSRLSATLDGEDRRTDRRTRAPQARAHRMHRLRLPVARPLPARQPRRPRRPLRARPPLLDRRSARQLTPAGIVAVGRRPAHSRFKRRPTAGWESLATKVGRERTARRDFAATRGCGPTICRNLVA